MRTKISKQIASIAALTAVIATTTFAQSEPVYSVNVIGMQKQSVIENLQLMSNPFEAMTIRELVGNSGTFGNSPDVADNFILYDADTQQYTTYYLRSHSSVGVEWRSGTTWATNVIVSPGQGFFYRSRQSGARTNVVVGDVIMETVVTNTVTPGLQLLSYPYSSRTRISDLNLKQGVFGNSPDIADNIILYDGGTQGYVTYYLRSHSSVGIEWRSGTTWATNVFVEPGQGFFFRSRSGVTYDWTENSPYPNL